MPEFEENNTTFESGFEQENQESTNESTQKPWTVSVKTTTSLQDVDAIKRKSQSPSDFVLDIPLTKSQFRMLFEDPETTSSGADYDSSKVLERLESFFASSAEKQNNEVLSADLYQLMVTNFSDITVSVPSLNAACSSNLKPNSDDTKNNVVFKYFSSANTTTMSAENQTLKVYEAISQKLNFMIERNDPESPYHYTKFWDNSMNNNTIMLEGSIITPSSQTLSVLNYTHPENTTASAGWCPCSIKFVQSPNSYGYK